MVPTALVGIGDAHVHPGPRQADRLAALDAIIAHGLTLPNLGAWLWPGDLYHTTSTAADRNAIVARLLRMNAAAPVVITYGNHDTPGDLDLLAHLAGPWPVIVVATPQVLRLPLATGARASIFVLPYPHRAGLVSAGTAHADLGQDARTLLEPIFMAATDELRAAAKAGDLCAFIAHVNIGGSMSSVGQPQIQREIELDPALLDRLGNMPKIVNHVHKAQTIHGAHYAGSICPMDFGEMEAKGFLVVECEPVPAEQVEGITELPSAWSFDVVTVPLAIAPQYHIEGALTREGFTYQVVAGPGGAVCDVPASWAGADLRVRYTYRAGELSALDEAHVHAEFAGCRSMKLEKVRVSEEALRAPEVIAAVTLPDKLERYCALTGIAWTPALAEKVDALQQLDLEGVVATWRRRTFAPAAPHGEKAVA
jgi:hypothetical protein